MLQLSIWEQLVLLSTVTHCSSVVKCVTEYGGGKGWVGWRGRGQNVALKEWAVTFYRPEIPVLKIWLSFWRNESYTVRRLYCGRIALSEGIPLVDFILFYFKPHLPDESYRRATQVFAVVFMCQLSSANQLPCLLILNFPWIKKQTETKQLKNKTNPKRTAWWKNRNVVLKEWARYGFGARLIWRTWRYAHVRHQLHNTKYAVCHTTLVPLQYCDEMKVS